VINISNLKRVLIIIAIVTTLALAGFGTSTILAGSVNVTPDSTNVQMGNEVTGLEHGINHFFVNPKPTPYAFRVYDGDGWLGYPLSGEIRMSGNFDVIFD